MRRSTSAERVDPVETASWRRVPKGSWDNARLPTRRSIGVPHERVQPRQLNSRRLRWRGTVQFFKQKLQFKKKQLTQTNARRKGRILLANVNSKIDCSLRNTRQQQRQQQDKQINGIKYPSHSWMAGQSVLQLMSVPSSRVIENRN